MSIKLEMTVKCRYRNDLQKSIGVFLPILALEFSETGEPVEHTDILLYTMPCVIVFI